MPQNTKHPEFSNYLRMWEKCRDAISGEERMKARATEYLPKLPGQADSRYDAYVKRAQYVNYVGKILDTSINQVFRKAPIVTEVPAEWLEDIDLCGKSFASFSKEILSEILKVNRVGVLIDYSDELNRPYLVPFTAEQIINWQTKRASGGYALSRVVIEGETQKEGGDPYKPEYETIWKEYVIDDETGAYTVKTWRKDRDEMKLAEENVPLIKGKALDFIPFLLMGASGISISPSKGPFVDLVNINVAHFRNSADYENRLHITGAVTLVTRGPMADGSVPMGGVIQFTGADGDAKFLEATSDGGLAEAMQKKVEQLAQLGSSIISGKGRYVASAESQRLTSEGEYASLADISGTLSDSMTKALRIMLKWAGKPSENASVMYNKDFESASADPSELRELFTGMLGGGWSFKTFYHNLRAREFYPEGHTIEDELKEINETQKMITELRAKSMENSLREVYGAAAGSATDEK